ncbi:MAG: benzoate-CoA ligase family protein [Clostridia bacterium]|nr:benzoate-CoA ligase family protein [Clostridia bacterium]
MTEPILEIPEKLNCAVEMVDKNIKLGRGQKIAILCQDQSFTYEDVYKEVNKFGNALRNLGVSLEDRVLLLLLDCQQYAFSFFGAIKIGAVPIPTNTMLKAKDYLYLLNDSRAKVAVVSEDLVPLIEEVRGELRFLQHLIVVGNAGPNQIAYEQLVANASTELEPADTGKDDVAFWLYSSGTTGSPKGTVHLQHDMLVATEYYAKGVLGINENDITFSVARLFFAYGLGNGLYFPFSVGATTVLNPERPEPKGIFEVIKRYKPTLFFCVPTAYGAMLQMADKLPEVDMSSIRHCVSAGEALPKPIFEAWHKKFNLTILDGIGSTEILHIFISNQPGDIKPGSTGKPVPGYEAKIVDADGNRLPAMEVGILMIKGDSIAAYYWNKHEKSKETFHGPWINTGDNYYMDEDGYYWYVGRGDDMIKAGGIWVSPLEVENTILEHDSVQECGVVGAIDKDNLEKPKAFIVLKEGIEASEELAKEIQNYVKSRIALYKYPRWIEFVSDLPKTATGKTMRYVLKQLNK